MIINGKEFEIDFMDVETAERYEAALKAYCEDCNEISTKQAKSTAQYSDSIRLCCEMIFNFIDTILGDSNASNKIFGESCNLREAFKAFNEIIAEFERQTEEMKGIIPIAVQSVNKNRFERWHGK